MPVEPQFKEDYRMELHKMDNDTLWSQVLFNCKHSGCAGPFTEEGFKRVASIQEMDKRLTEINYLTPQS